MRVLIAGASGVLGRHMAWEITAAGHQVIALGRTPDGSGALKDMGAEFVRADLLDREGLLRALDGQHADAVIHAATALSSTPLRHSQMAGTDRLRTTGTANLVDAAREIGAKRLVSESMHVGYGYRDFGDTPVTEDTPFAPQGQGAAVEPHLAGFREKERLTFHSDGIEGVSLRFGALYGPGFGVGGTDTIVELLRARKLPVADGGGVLNWTDLRDAGRATLLALERGEAGRAYNIVDDTAVSLTDHIRRAAEVFGTPRPRTVPMWLLRFAAPYVHTMMKTSMHVSNARARRELGWEPTTASSLEGLRKLAG
ncbi:GDP-6-deoxy-D-mannose reductase [Streptomyces sp. RB5]|uniref:GDP-6-deoxy-D-mannose reductase n=1 Tax=Streptomyces smaragdinus TaxID=2585196 RepID=A0A7K0CA08_9ACTN|nr:NAD(P)-dependent oxidoreductase [Streptomyces smaragdinus]MQY10290.1 GDP-6-deoxy-D-mannose reductase [Streptomyces smaragdinus]